MSDLPHPDLIVPAEALEGLREALAQALRQAGAICGLLISRDDGSLIAATGDLAALDVTSLAALAAGTFASAREIARLIGEPEFTVLFHQGQRQHIHVSLAGERMLLMLLFGDLRALPEIRSVAEEVAETAARLLAASPDRDGGPGWFLRDRRSCL